MLVGQSSSLPFGYWPVTNSSPCNNEGNNFVKKPYPWPMPSRVRPYIQDINFLYEGPCNAKGQPHGQGKLSSPEDHQFEGTFVDGNATGQGTYTSKAYKYTGEWLNNKLHGYGTEKYEAEDEGFFFEDNRSVEYTGNFDNNCIHGKGSLTKCGSNYTGDFNMGMSHGTGTMKWSKKLKINFSEYSGEWVNGNMCGKGTVKLKNGDTYQGNCVYNGFHQTWVLTTAEGKAFLFKDGPDPCIIS
jgi:hypothetical protein